MGCAFEEYMLNEMSHTTKWHGGIGWVELVASATIDHESTIHDRTLDGAMNDAKAIR